MAGLIQVTGDTDELTITKTANTVNVMTEIFSAKVPLAKEIRLYNGTIVKMKLHTGADAELPNNAKIIFGYRLPGKTEIEELGALTYQPFASTSVAEQEKPETASNRRLKFNNSDRSIRLKSQRELVFKINSSTAMDWSNSWIDFEVEQFIV